MATSKILKKRLFILRFCQFLAVFPGDLQYRIKISFPSVEKTKNEHSIA